MKVWYNGNVRILCFYGYSDGLTILFEGLGIDMSTDSFMTMLDSDQMTELKVLQQNILERKSEIDNEEATKHSLIIPFIQFLGYDVHSPFEVKPEYVADFSSKYGEKVDYALCINNQPVIFIEAKSVAEDLTCHTVQLSRYFNATPAVKVAVLTNGVNYRFFSDLLNENIMDDEPFWEFSFTDLQDNISEMLTLFNKAYFDPYKIKTVARQLYYQDSITNKLKELLEEPTDDFIRLLAKDFTKAKITSTSLNKLRPIVDLSINAVIKDIVKNHNVAHEPTDPSDDKLIPSLSDKMKGYNYIYYILGRAKKDIRFVDFKDTVSYFAVYNHNIKNWFIRLVLDRPPCHIMVNLSYDVVKPLCGKYVVRSMDSKGIARILIDDVNDLLNLSDVIIKAFETIA